MKKNNRKALVLAKETLKRLSGDALRSAAGAVSGFCVTDYCSAASCLNPCDTFKTQYPSICITACNPSIPYDSCICLG